jgi:hypothetical protein
MTQAAMAEQGFVYLHNKAGGSYITPAQRYAHISAKAHEIALNPEPKHKASVLKLNADLLRMKEVGPSQVQSLPFLNNVSVQYANDEYIGEMLMPVIQVGQMSGEYHVYDKRSRLAAPDDAMANRTVANEISDNRSLATYATKGYALKNFVTVITLRNQMAPLDEMVDLTEAVAEVMALKREERIVAKLTTAANYAASNKITLAAGSRFGEANANIISTFQTAVAATWTGRGPGKLIAAMSLDVWNVIARDPQVLDLFKANKSGLATPNDVAGYFGLDGILVSRARHDTANEGQTAVYERIWGKFLWVGRVASRPSIRNAGFGATLRWGQQLTRVWFDPQISTEGGYYAQVSVHEDHNVQAADTSYLISDAIP